MARKRKTTRRAGRTGAPGRGGDFGVPSTKPAAQRAASKRIRGQHRGGRSESGDVQPRAGTDTREAGVGGQEAGSGSYSGGDLDTSIVGVGTGGSGIAASGPDEERGPSESSGGSEEFASGPPARGSQPTRTRPPGSTVSRGGEETENR